MIKTAASSDAATPLRAAPASGSLKLAYSVVLLGAALPFGLAASGWVRMANPGALLPMAPYLFLLLLALYRVYLVALVPGTLASYPAAGFSRMLRALGAFGLYFGALAAIANLAAGPLMRMFMKTRTESGAEFFVVGVYLSVLGGVGLAGLFLYEMSRLIAFERQTSGDVGDGS